MRSAQKGILSCFRFCPKPVCVDSKVARVSGDYKIWGGAMMMKRSGCAVALVAFWGLSACEVPVMIAAENNDAALSGLTSISFPARMLMVLNGSEEVIYRGEMIGYMSGSADIALATDDGRTCTGAMDPSGTGQLNCDGVLIEMTRAESETTSMSGTVYRDGQLAGTRYATVFGWGRGAQENALRQSMAQQRSFGGREAREVAG